MYVKKHALFFTIFIFLLPLISLKAFAISPEIILKNMKLLTPEVKEEKRYIIPQNFSTTNNLRRKVGSSFVAKGRFLYIEGFVFDLVGVPVENAVVKIWQTNHFGYYNYLVANKDDYSKYDIDFNSTGTCITDSNGHYSFFTIIPGYYGETAPHINFIVEHENFERLETMLFFSMNFKNTTDKIYKSLNQKSRYLITCNLKNFTSNDLEYGKKCSFDIRLNGLHQRKRF